MVNSYIDCEAELVSTSIAPLKTWQFWLISWWSLLHSLTMSWVSERIYSLENTHTGMRLSIFNFQSIFTRLLLYLIPFHRLGGESLARLLSYNITMMSELAATSHLQKSTCYFWFQEHSQWQKINKLLHGGKWMRFGNIQPKFESYFLIWKMRLIYIFKVVIRIIWYSTYLEQPALYLIHGRTSLNDRE